MREIAGLHVCVYAHAWTCWECETRSPKSMFKWQHVIWFFFDWRWFGRLCFTECSQMDDRQWVWEVGKVSEREEGRVNAMRSGTLKKKYLKIISKTFVLLSVKWILRSSQKSFVKSDFWGRLVLLKLCMCFSQMLHHNKEKTALYMDGIRDWGSLLTFKLQIFW